MSFVKNVSIDRKILRMSAALLATALTIGLTACGSADEADTTLSGQTAEQADPDTGEALGNTVVSYGNGTQSNGAGGTTVTTGNSPAVETGTPLSLSQIQMKVSTGDQHNAGTDSRIRVLFCRSTSAMDTENCARITIDTSNTLTALERGQNIQTFVFEDLQDLSVITDTSFLNYIRIENLTPAQGGLKRAILTSPQLCLPLQRF